MLSVLFSLEKAFILRKEPAKLNTNAQNSFFYVKIGLWILTTNLTNKPINYFVFHSFNTLMARLEK